MLYHKRNPPRVPRVFSIILLIGTFVHFIPVYRTVAILLTSHFSELPSSSRRYLVLPVSRIALCVWFFFLYCELMKRDMQELNRMRRAGTLRICWILWRFLTWTETGFRFPISGKTGKLLLHLRVILGICLNSSRLITVFQFIYIALKVDMRCCRCVFCRKRADYLASKKVTDI